METGPWQRRRWAREKGGRATGSRAREEATSIKPPGRWPTPDRAVPRGTRDTAADAQRRDLRETPSHPPHPGPGPSAGRGFTRLGPRPYCPQDARSADAASGLSAHPYRGAHFKVSHPRPRGLRLGGASLERCPPEGLTSRPRGPRPGAASLYRRPPRRPGPWPERFSRNSARHIRAPVPASPETVPPAPSKGSQEGTATRPAANLIHHQTAC